MKKILATALILSLSTAVWTSPVLADSQEKTQTPKNVVVKKVQGIESKTMEGVIKEIQDHAWIVIGEDGKEYTVPTFGFEQLDDFKSVNPTTGSKVTLEGTSFNPGDAPVKITRAIDSAKADGDISLSENIRVFKYDSAQGAVEVDQEEIQKMMKDKGIGAIKAVEAIPFEGEKNMLIKKGEGDLDLVKVFKIGNKSGIAGLNTEDVRQTLIVKEPEAIKIEAGATGEGKMMLKGKGLLKELKGDVFMAHAITMDGKTLKLPMMRLAMPAMSAVEIEKE